VSVKALSVSNNSSHLLVLYCYYNLRHTGNNVITTTNAAAASASATTTTFNSVTGHFSAVPHVRAGPSKDKPFGNCCGCKFLRPDAASSVKQLQVQLLHVLLLLLLLLAVCETTTTRVVVVVGCV